MFHPNSNSKYRGVKNLICNNLLRKYRHGIPPETQHYEDNGYPLSTELKIYTENGSITIPAFPIKKPNGEKARVVAHLGQSSVLGVNILHAYS